jgi:uncharacterized membrane protein YfcA
VFFLIYIIGIISGLASGFFGSGGGLIIVPALVSIFNTDEYIARGTALTCILPMVITSLFFYFKNSYINWNIAFYTAIGGVIRRIFRCKTYE